MACHFLVPEAVGIVAIEWQHLTKGDWSAQFRPSCTGVERQIETNLLSYLFESHKVGTVAAIFVVELGSDDWTTVLPLQALYLRKNLAIQFLGQTKKYRVLLTEATALRKDPVRNATIAYLTVTERAQTQDDGHLLLFADFQETAQVSLSVPTEDAFLFLNMTPEDVGGNDSHPTLAHLANLALPLVGRNTRIMDFAHHRTDAMSIDDKTALQRRVAQLTMDYIYQVIYLSGDSSVRLFIYHTET